MDEFKLDKDGNVIETFGDVMAALRKLKASGEYARIITPKPKIDHYAYCKSCFRYNACCGMDVEDHMFDMTECEDYISVMTPEKFAEEMGKIRTQLDEDEIYHDEEDCHIKMDDLMMSILRALGYGEGIDIYENTPKWYA